jgi:two-component system, response regulator
MKRSILIVDDSPDDIELTILAIERCRTDLMPYVARDGKMALELLGDSKKLPSMILLDLKMPGMGGVDFLREIRANERLKEIPVIIVTTSNLDADRTESLKAGANDFLHKDFRMDHFCNQLETLMDRWIAA